MKQNNLIIITNPLPKPGPIFHPFTSVINLLNTGPGFGLSTSAIAPSTASLACHSTSTGSCKVAQFGVLARHSKCREAVGALRCGASCRLLRFEGETLSIRFAQGPVDTAKGIIAGVTAVSRDVLAASEGDLTANHQVLRARLVDFSSAILDRSTRVDLHGRNRDCSSCGSLGVWLSHSRE